MTVLMEPEPTAADHGPDVLYRIEKSPGVGRYMVADRDIAPGEVIFTDLPACIGPDNSSKPLCLGCHRKVSGSFKCAGCRWPLCRAECARSPLHRHECDLFQARKAVVNVPWFDKPCAYYDAILPLRVLLLKRHQPKVYRLVTLLMDHNDHLEESSIKHRQRVVDFLRKTCRLADDFSESEIHHVLGILSVNSFVIADAGETSLDLIGLYPWTSLMSHACAPNTKIVTRDDFSYVCVATVNIKQGQEIVTSYHHYHYQLYGTAYRRKDLKHTWSFDCICRRCSDRSEFGTFVSAVVCDTCKLGHMLPVDPLLNAESAWTCDHCHARALGTDISERVSRFESDIDGVSAADADEYERLLRKMRYFLHENHYWILDVKRRLIDIYGNKPGFELYKLPQNKLEAKVEYCEQLLQVGRKVCPGASELRGYLLWEAHGARMRLAQFKWTRMKITTKQYVETLKQLCLWLEEVLDCLGQIRADADEGQMAARARDELRQMNELLVQLQKQTSTADIAGTGGRLNSSSSSLSSALSSSTTSLALVRAKSSSSSVSVSNAINRRSICV